MKLLWLKEIIGDAYTEDMDAAACQAIGKDFVARADFNAKNTRVKELEAQVGQLEEAAKGHAKQLEELKKSAGDNEELTRKIGELEQQNKADKAAYEKELATIRLTAAVDAELTAAGAKNNTAVRALLADYLKDAKIEDGKVVATLRERVGNPRIFDFVAVKEGYAMGRQELREFLPKADGTVFVFPETLHFALQPQ